MTFCSFVAPHHPFEAPQDQLDRYDRKSIPDALLKGGVDKSSVPPRLTDAWNTSAWDKYPDEIRHRIIWHYLASISLVDDGVGRLLSALERSGQMDNTIIIFTSDHGEHLGNHGMLKKDSIHYDETLRVPLIISVPGATGGRRVKGLVEMTDLHPTLLGLLEIPINPGVQGIDWSVQLRNGGEIARDDIYSDMFDLTPQKFGKFKCPYSATQTLRTEKWKLNIYPTAGQQYGQLFDLENDPDESRNLYADPNSRSVREVMLWKMNSRVHRNTDPLPLYLTQF